MRRYLLAALLGALLGVNATLIACRRYVERVTRRRRQDLELANPSEGPRGDKR